MKLRFKIGKLSIEDLAVDFEGNEQERRVVERMVDVIGSLPGAVLDVEPTEVSPQRQIAAPAPQPRRRRSPRRTASSNGEGSALGNDGSGAQAQTEGKAARGRKPRGDSYRGQINRLIQENFFAHKRTNEDIRNELIRRGHTFELRRITEAIVALCKRDRLSRNVNADVPGGWEYENFTGAGI